MSIEIINRFVQLDHELHPKVPVAPAAEKTVETLDTRIAAINKKCKEFVSNLQADEPIILPSDSEYESELEIMNISKEVKILNKEMRSKAREKAEGWDAVKLYFKIIFSLGLYKSYAPQLDPKPLTLAVTKCLENFKLLKLPKELAAIEHSDFAPPVLTSSEKCFYPWKNSRTNDFMISIVDASGQKNYKCSFDQLSVGKVILDGGEDNPSISLEKIALPIASSKDLEAKLHNALAKNDLVKARPYGEVQFEAHVNKLVKSYDSDDAYQELNGLKGKIVDKAIVVITKDKQNGDFVLSTLKNGKISQEIFSVDVNGRVNFTNAKTGFPKSVGEFKDSIINQQSMFVDEAINYSKLENTQKAAIEEQMNVIKVGAEQTGLLKSPADADNFRKELAERLKIMSPVDAGAFIYQAGTEFKVVCGNEKKEVVEHAIHINTDGSVKYREDNFPKDSNIVMILKTPFKKVEDAQNAYIAMKPVTTAVQQDPCANLRANPAYCEDNNATGVFENLGAFFTNKAQLAGTWALTPNEPKKAGMFWKLGAAVVTALTPDIVQTGVKKAVGLVAGEIPFSKFTLWAHNGADVVKFTPVDINPANKEKPYQYLGVSYSTPEEIVKAQLESQKKIVKEIKPYTSLEVVKSDCLEFEKEIESQNYFIPVGQYDDLIAELAQNPNNKNKFAIQKIKDGEYRVLVFGPKDAQVDNKVFYTRKQGLDPNVSNAQVWDSANNGYPVTTGIVLVMRPVVDEQGIPLKPQPPVILELDVRGALKLEQEKQRQAVMPGAFVEPEEVIGIGHIEDRDDFIPKAQLMSMLGDASIDKADKYCITWDEQDGVQFYVFDENSHTNIRTVQEKSSGEFFLTGSQREFDSMTQLLAYYENNYEAMDIHPLQAKQAPSSSSLSPAKRDILMKHPAFVDAKMLNDEKQFLKSNEAYALTVKTDGTPAFVRWTKGEQYTLPVTERDGKFVIDNITAPTLDALVPIMTKNNLQPAKVLLAQHAVRQAVQPPIQPQEKPIAVFQNVIVPQPQQPQPPKPAAVEPVKPSEAPAPAATVNKQGSPEVVANMVKLSKAFRNPKNNDKPYNLGSAAYLTAVKELWVQCDKWKSSNTALTSEQAKQALGLVLNNVDFGKVYNKLEDITSLRTADIPTPKVGGKPARDALLAWLWQQK